MNVPPLRSRRTLALPALVTLVTSALLAASSSPAVAHPVPHPGCGPNSFNGWKDGTFGTVLLHYVRCSRAVRAIRDAIARRVVRYSDQRRWAVARKRVLGFRFSYPGAGYAGKLHARDGPAHFSIYLCWYNVNC